MKKYIILRNVDMAFLQIFFFCGSGVMLHPKSASESLWITSFKSLCQGSNFSKVILKPRIFCSTPKPQTTCENSAKQSPALWFEAVYLLPNVLRFMYSICKSKEKGQEDVQEVGHLKIKLLDSYLF